MKHALTAVRADRSLVRFLACLMFPLLAVLLFDIVAVLAGVPVRVANPISNLATVLVLINAAVWIGVWQRATRTGRPPRGSRTRIGTRRTWRRSQNR